MASMDYLQVYNQTSKTMRQAAGHAPVAAGDSGLTASEPGSGSIEPGVRKIAVAYLTDTGFITPPGPTLLGIFIPTTYTASGSKNLLIGNIPTGPTGTTGRYLLITKANEEEYFFIPNGYIGNNTATSITVDFSDVGLVSSADYLFDLFDSISGGVVTNYHGRLVVGIYQELLVSRPGDPESISQVTGVLPLPLADSTAKVSGVFVHRDVLYVTLDPKGIYLAVDNGGDPSTWQVSFVDGSVGSYQHCIASTASPETMKTSFDVVVIGSRHGLYLFDGSVRAPELTWKVEDTWNSLFSSLSATQVVVDPDKNRVYVAFQVGNIPVPMLVGDYSEAIISGSIDPMRIKWSTWKFHKSVSTIALARLGPLINNPQYRLYFGSMDPYSSSIWSLTYDLTDDNNSINAYYKTALIDLQPGWVSFFLYLLFRANGAQTMTLELSGEDGQNVINPTGLTLSVTSGRELARKINYVGEKMSVKFGMNNPAGYFVVNKLEIEGNPMWPQRPA
jgi:hypothetical protein